MKTFLLVLILVSLVASAAALFCWWAWYTYPTPYRVEGPLTIYVRPDGADWRWRDCRTPETACKSTQAGMLRVPKVIGESKMVIQGLWRIPK